MTMNDRTDRALMFVIACVILVMLLTCQTGKTQMAGAEPEVVSIPLKGTFESITVCWVVPDLPLSVYPEQCESVPLGKRMTNAEVDATCIKMEADVKLALPEVQITKCSRQRESI